MLHGTEQLALIFRSLHGFNRSHHDFSCLRHALAFNLALYFRQNAFLHEILIHLLVHGDGTVLHVFIPHGDKQQTHLKACISFSA